MNHSFDVDFATEYGIEEAILINHFEFWIAKNKANKANIHDGRYWTYNGAKAFAELFPYMTDRKIRTTIESLRSKGLILTGNFNTNSYDRTLWYALTDSAISILQKSQLHLTKTANGSDDKVNSLDTDTQPDTNTGTETTVTTSELAFAVFWKVYPKKAKKPDAIRAWKKIKPPEYNKIFSSIPKFSASEQWTKQGGAFVPNPASWLNGQCWNDDIPGGGESATKTCSPKYMGGSSYKMG